MKLCNHNTHLSCQEFLSNLSGFELWLMPLSHFPILKGYCFDDCSGFLAWLLYSHTQTQPRIMCSLYIYYYYTGSYCEKNNTELLPDDYSNSGFSLASLFSFKCTLNAFILNTFGSGCLATKSLINKHHTNRVFVHRQNNWFLWLIYLSTPLAYTACT